VSKQGETGGDEGDENGGNSMGTSPATARVQDGKLNPINEMFRHSQGSGISGWQTRHEKGKISKGNKGENIMGNTHFNMGVSVGDDSHHAFKEKIPVI
jgi:hypothetical protein